MKSWKIISAATVLGLVLSTAFIALAVDTKNYIDCSSSGFDFSKYFEETKINSAAQGINDLEYKELTNEQTNLLLSKGVWIAPNKVEITADSGVYGRVLSSAKSPNTIVVAFVDREDNVCVAVGFYTTEFMKQLEE